jgi:iron complex transport system substrate-binding protein
VRVVSLLPAATEIVAALGGSHLLVGISHECDYPSSVQHLPRVTATPVNPDAPGSAIDEQVRRLARLGQPVIAINADQLRRLSPDLILTQGLCEVCAVSDGQAHRLASSLASAPRVLSLTAQDLSGVWHDIFAVGTALDLEDEAEELVLGLQSRLRGVQSTAAGTRPRVLCLEWLDPLFLAGHWVPELVAAAGGVDVGARAGSRSRRAEWEELLQLKPDCILVMLCGFAVGRARTELERLADPTALELLASLPTWIIDGNAYTSRAGPRVVDAAALMQSAFSGRTMPGLERWEITAVC